MTSWPKWLAPAVATVAVVFLPALQLSAPLLTTNQWSILQLGSEVAQAAQPHAQPSNLRVLLHQAEQLRQQFGGEATSTQWKMPLALAALIPVSALIAGLAALLSWIWVAWCRRRIFLANAVVGLLAAVYAIGASWWLTHVAQTQISHLLDRLHLGSLQPSLGPSLALAPQVGLYVLLLVFLAMLLWPLELTMRHPQ